MIVRSDRFVKLGKAVKLFPTSLNQVNKKNVMLFKRDYFWEKLNFVVT
jgi:hypothetical protein